MSHHNDCPCVNRAVLSDAFPPSSIHYSMRRQIRKEYTLYQVFIYNFTRNKRSQILFILSICTLFYPGSVRCIQQRYSYSHALRPAASVRPSYYICESSFLAIKRIDYWRNRSLKHKSSIILNSENNFRSSVGRAYKKNHVKNSRPVPDRTSKIYDSSSSNKPLRRLRENSKSISSYSSSQFVATFISLRDDLHYILEKQSHSSDRIDEGICILRSMLENLHSMKEPTKDSSNVITSIHTSISDTDLLECSKIIDESIIQLIQHFFFSIQDRKKASSTKRYWFTFYHTLQIIHKIYTTKSSLTLQNLISSPYHLISISTIRTTLKILNSLILQDDSKKKRDIVEEGSNLLYQEVDTSGDVDTKVTSQMCLSLCYRLFQRWINGYGIRQVHSKSKISSSGKIQSITTEINERDISILLNAYVIMRNMTMAHRIIALQERSDATPPLSPVAYSILIKGYGRLKDKRGLDTVVGHAKRNNIQPDIVMCNGLMDAYVNCGDVHSAYDLFLCISQAKTSWKELNINCKPNVRTYNTMLKGFAKTGNLQQSMILFNKMKVDGMFDAVTINTLVSVAVSVSQYHVAESLLSNYTDPVITSMESKGLYEHPNVEAYTELIDGYGKAGRLSEAVQLLQTMRTRGVKPNEITYTSMIGAMSRHQRLKQAKDMLRFMEAVDRIKPGIITYNAMISGLLLGCTQVKSVGNLPVQDGREWSTRVDAAVDIYTSLRYFGVRPNAITISMIIDALSRCYPSRFTEAKEILVVAEEAKIIRKDDIRVGTSMIRAHASIGDIEGCIKTYNKLEKKDLVSFNVLLDSLCKYGKVQKALLMFAQLSSKNSAREEIVPDVITYSILIGELLKVESSHALSNVKKLYKDMKFNRGIMPDCGLIDM